MVGPEFRCPLGFLGVLAVAFLSSSPAAGGDRHPFTSEVLVGMEAFGAVRVSATGRWAVFEKQAPYNSAASYDYGALTGALLSDLVIIDTTGKRPDLTLGTGDTAGYQSGPISPDGQKMVVFHLQGRKRRLGVLTFETGALSWFDLSPEVPVLGRTLVWRNDREIIAIVTADEALPLYYRLGWQPQSVISERWRAAGAGSSPTSTFVTSGSDRDQRPRAKPSRLVRLDVETGGVVTLLEGGLFDLELSPGGRTVAILANAEDLQPDPDRPARIGAPTRRRRILLVDLASTHVVSPAPDRDLLSHLLMWSPDGREVLVFGRRDSERWEDGHFLRISATGAKVAPVDLEGARPAILTTSGERIALVRATWTGDHPTMLVETRSGSREWLTPHAPLRADPTTIDSFGRFAFAGGRAHFWSADGVSSAGGRMLRGWRPISGSTAGDGGGRARWNPVARELGAQAVADDDGCLRPSVDAARALCLALGQAEQLMAASADGRTAVFQGQSAQGVGRLVLATRGGRRVLAEINPGFARVNWGAIREVGGGRSGGSTNRHWLLTPAGDCPEGGWPTIVLIYPGKTYGSAPSALRPASATTQLNPHVFAAAGYAVLMPSLPLAADRGPDDLADLADRILTIVDVAASDGAIDRGRLVLMGHSFGGYAALRTAAQTNRFRAVVASAAAADLGSFLKDTVAATAVPEDGLWITGAAGSLETGQLAMAVPPWSDPGRYTAASPIYLADAIRTPVLLVRGDLDPVGAESLFAGLYRLGRDAGLLTYWGEGHNLASPANVVDLHARVVDWLGRRLGSPQDVDPAPPSLDP